MSDLAAQFLAAFPDPALAFTAFSALMARLKVRSARLARTACRPAISSSAALCTCQLVPQGRPLTASLPVAACQL